MKAHALVPALALAAALLAPPLTEAASRHRSDGGRRPPAHGYYRGPSHGDYGHHYRSPRPYYRPYRYHAVPYYGYGYGGYGYAPYGYGYDGSGYGYGYGYYPPPPPRYCPPRPRAHIGFWFGF